MSVKSAPDLEILNSNQIKFNDLVGSSKGHAKELFISSLKNGYSHDSMGHLFEKSLEKFDRKDIGQFYTPKEIVEYMISQFEVKKDSKILDLSCGCGSFLLTTFDIFKKKYGAEFIKNIFGVDINEDAVDMTRLCLYAKADFNNTHISIIKNNIKTGNSIISNRVFDKTAFDWDTEFKDPLNSGGFDFIIGNPPYVTMSSAINFDSSESIYQKITNGAVNAATLMIGRSLELLKDGGVLAFLLPKSILYVDSYSKLRNYLAQNTEIQQIYDLGSKFKDVRGEQFILFLRKQLPSKSSKVRIRVFEDKNKNLSEQFTAEVSQSDIVKMGKFYTFDSPEHYKVIRKLSNIGIKLGEYVNERIFRGLSIGGNLAQKSAGVKCKNVIRGKDIAKFRLKDVPFMNNSLLELQSKNKTELLKQKKVVLQNIFSAEAGAIAAYDPNGLLSIDTVTNILVKNDEQGKYLLGLLNSKLINFYIMYALFNRSRLTMHLDKSYIGLIPILQNPSKQTINRLCKVVDILCKTDDLESIRIKKREIDGIVYKLYSLNKNEINLIENAVNKILSSRSAW